MTTSIEYALADWQNTDDCNAVVSMLQRYAMHPMGGSEPLSDYATNNLANVMQATPGAFSVIAWQADEQSQKQAVGLANCFTGMSTFACKPLINIHDLYVDTVARGQGTGQGLLEYVQQQARDRGCCKVTLEVLSGNTKALDAYLRFGFKHYSLDDNTGHALFMHKSI